MHRKVIAIVVVVASLLAFAASAGAAIVLNQGAAGITLGQSRAAVRATLGTPSSAQPGHDGTPADEFKSRGIAVLYARGTNKVKTILVTTKKERLPGGVGVGSTEAEIKRAVPDAMCMNMRGGRYCMTMSGSAATMFDLKGGHVKSILIANANSLL
jgi:hypothetical protein